MTNQTTPELLREIADVMEERPEDGYKEFRYQLSPADGREFVGWQDLIRSTCACPAYTIRKPRTIKVSGEVPEEIIEDAKKIAGIKHERHAYARMARTLLDLIDGGE